MHAQSRVCDVGCGVDALFLEHIKDRARLRVGFDYQRPIARGPGLLLVEGSLDHGLPFRSTSFDHVTLLAVIEHLTEPEPVLREAHRILAPGGTLILTWPSASVDAILAVLRPIGLVSPEMEADQHQPRRPPAEWRRFLSGIGFEAIRHRTFEFGLNHLLIARRARV